jgi:hypothetical protein
VLRAAGSGPGCRGKTFSAIAATLAATSSMLRASPAHIGVRHGEFNLLRWLDTFIFYNKKSAVSPRST